MGNLDSPYTQVTAFYSYWLGFVTIMDFCWVDNKYDAMAGPNRKSRSVMEDENKKLRKKVKKEYNDTVRGLAEFVKKRDKRVTDMAMKRNLEMEKKEEERERKKRLERERLERAMAYEEPDWVKVGEADGVDYNGLYKEERKKNEEKELYCVVCGKKFKSEKQWSKKGRDKRNGEENSEVDTNRSNAQTEEHNGHVENSQKEEEESPRSLADKENVVEEGDGELVMKQVDF